MQLGPYRAIDQAFGLKLEGNAPVDVRSIFAGLEDPAVEPNRTFRLTFDQPDGRGSLHDGDHLITTGTARVLLQGVISRLGQSLTEDGQSAAVHATTVGDERGGAMLVGPSRSGKSTLATALMVGGMRLVAEDVTIFDDDLRARPYHRPLGLANASFELVGLDVPHGVDDHCGCGGKMLASTAQLGFGVQGATPIRLVALCDRTSGTLQRISPARMLVRMLEKGVAPLGDPGTHLEVLARVLSNAVCVELGTQSLPMAAEWVDQIDKPAEPAHTLVEVHGDRADVFCGDEAVIVQLDAMRAHHLNRSAAAVWLLHTDGLGAADIASQLGTDLANVEEALAQLGPARLQHRSVQP